MNSYYTRKSEDTKFQTLNDWKFVQLTESIRFMQFLQNVVVAIKFYVKIPTDQTWTKKIEWE